MSKAVNVLTIISFLIFLAILLMVYSYLPVMVNVNPGEYGWSFHKEYFFYGLLTGFVILNIFMFLLSRMLQSVISSDEIMAWIKGLTFVLNFYLACLVGYVGVINNAQHFQQGSYGYLNYVGPVLIVSWCVGLIFLLINKNKTA